MAWLRRKHSFLLGFLVPYVPLARFSGRSFNRRIQARTGTAQRIVNIYASLLAAWTSLSGCQRVELSSWVHT